MSNTRAILILRTALMSAQERGDAMQAALTAARTTVKRIETDMLDCGAEIESIQAAISALGVAKDG